MTKPTVTDRLGKEMLEIGARPVSSITASTSPSHVTLLSVGEATDMRNCSWSATIGGRIAYGFRSTLLVGLPLVLPGAMIE